MTKALKLNRQERDLRKAQKLLWGPDADLYEEPDWEALELQERAVQGLHKTHYEEES